MFQPVKRLPKRAVERVLQVVVAHAIGAQPLTTGAFPGSLRQIAGPVDTNAADNGGQNRLTGDEADAEKGHILAG